MLKIVDEELAGHAFIAGDDYCVADSTAMVAAGFLNVARILRPARMEEPRALAPGRLRPPQREGLRIAARV
jgi:hypothetical protein